MKKEEIFTKVKKAPLKYKLFAVFSVFMMSAGAYTIFVSGSGPSASITPSEIEIYPGESVTFDASDSNGDIVSYAWHFHDKSPTKSGKDLKTINHTFNKEGIYHITLFVNASNSKMDMATSKVIVKNHRPDISVNQDSYNVEEDEEVTFNASGSTDDSSIESYKWDFGDGEISYGEKVNRSFSKSGTYTVNLTVRDDRGKRSFRDITVTVNNPAPTADAGGNYNIEEGRSAYLRGDSSSDNPSDTSGLRYRWNNGYKGKRAMEFYGDDGSYSPSLDVKDDDGASDTDTANVNVDNTKPKIAVDGAYIKGNLTLRVAGEKWHDVELDLYESGEHRGHMNVTRGVSTPQTETISNITFDLTEQWEIHAEYTPEDDPVNGQPNGATPAWLILDFEGGASRWIHHTFNVVRNNTHDWNVSLNQYFFKPECENAPDIDECQGNPVVHFPYKVYDQGADDLTVRWNFSESYHEEVFKTSNFPNFVVDEFNFTPSEMNDFSLTVKDDDGASKTINLKIENGSMANVAPNVNAGEEKYDKEDSSLLFEGNASDSIGEDEFDFKFYFGDGNTASGKQIQHTYRFSSEYPVLLTVIDSHGAEGFDLTYANIDNVVPTADFITSSTISEDSPLNLNASTSHDSISDEPYLEYVWEMGDGVKEFGISPQHVYNNEGTYTIKLTVRDDDDSEDTLEKNITVDNVDPQAYVEPDLTVYGPKTEITFSGKGIDTFSDRASLDYTWTIDGTSFSGPKVKYTFTKSTTYTVTLTITDDDGSFSQDESVVKIGIDKDIDSLIDELEADKGTKPGAWDSDRDDVADYWEIYNYKTDPTKLDSDEDDAPDWFEISYMGYDVDTDGDGLKNPWDWDSDGDLISDGDEIKIDENDNVEFITNPLRYNGPTGNELYGDIVSVKEDMGPGYDVSVMIDYSGTSQKKPQISMSSMSSPDGFPVFDFSTDSEKFFYTIIAVRYPESEVESSEDKQTLTNKVDEDKLKVYTHSKNDWNLAKSRKTDTENNVAYYSGSEFKPITLANAANQHTDQDGLDDLTELTTYHPFKKFDFDVGGIIGISEGWDGQGGWDFGSTYDHHTSPGSWKMSGDSEGNLISPLIKPESLGNLEVNFWYKTEHTQESFGKIDLKIKGDGETKTIGNVSSTDGSWEKGTIRVKRIDLPSHNFRSIFDTNTTKNSRVYIDTITFCSTTNPRAEDSDKDGLPDGWYDYGVDGEKNTGDNGEGDGVFDNKESKGELGNIIYGGNKGYETSPVTSDTDGDSWGDLQELEEYHTDPTDIDTDGDGFLDSGDVNPLVDLELTVYILEWKQLDPVDNSPFKPGDFYIKVWVNGDKEISSHPGENHDQSHEYPNWDETWDVPDDEKDVDVEIALWDDDLKYNDEMDISSSGTRLDLSYDLKTSTWSGEDSDGETSGEDDGSTGSDEDDCYVQYDISQNSKDTDNLPYWEEVNKYNLDPTDDDEEKDDDGDGMNNAWEARNGLDPHNASDKNEDPDDDGIKNIDEYEHGWNPNKCIKSDVSYRVITVKPDDNKMTTKRARLGEDELRKWRTEDQNREDKLYHPANIDSISPSSDIIYPNIGEPVMADISQGSTEFSVYIEGARSDNIDDVKITKVKGNKEYDLDIVDGSESWDDRNDAKKIKLSLDGDEKSGLYTLMLNKNGERITAPNSVNIVDYSDGEIKIIQLTDIHIGPEIGAYMKMKVDTPVFSWSHKPVDEGFDPTEHHTANMFALLERINAFENPNFTVITGDLINYKEKKAAKAVRACLKRSEAPIFTLPGNHDQYMELLETYTDVQLPETPVSPGLSTDIKVRIPWNDGLDMYHKWISPQFNSGGEGHKDDFYIDYGGFRFIGLYTGESRIYKYDLSGNLIPNPSETYNKNHVKGYKDDQYSWFENNARGHQTFIFQHAPIVGHGGKHCILNHRKDFVDFANSNDVEAVFAGHTHGNWKFGTNPEGQVKKITESNMDDPPDFATNTVPLDWYTVYIETGSSTKE